MRWRPEGCFMLEPRALACGDEASGVLLEPFTNIHLECRVEPDQLGRPLPDAIKAALTKTFVGAMPHSSKWRI